MFSSRVVLVLSILVYWVDWCFPWFTAGVFFGEISGYFGGLTDMIVQRMIEILRSFPSIPLWMALAAALPPDWSLSLSISGLP